MPFIETKVNVKISEEAEKQLKAGLADAIACFPGKSEAWLMLNFEDQRRMYFKGKNNQPMAFLSVDLLGQIDAAASEKMTEKICTLMQEVLSIDPSRVYVKYTGIQNWGWNGGNF